MRPEQPERDSNIASLECYIQRTAKGIRLKIEAQAVQTATQNELHREYDTILQTLTEKAKKATDELHALEASLAENSSSKYHQYAAKKLLAEKDRAINEAFAKILHAANLDDNVSDDDQLLALLNSYQSKAVNKADDNPRKPHTPKIKKGLYARLQAKPSNVATLQLKASLKTLKKSYGKESELYQLFVAASKEEKLSTFDQNLLRDCADAMSDLHEDLKSENADSLERQAQYIYNLADEVKETYSTPLWKKIAVGMMVVTLAITSIALAAHTAGASLGVFALAIKKIAAACGFNWFATGAVGVTATGGFTFFAKREKNKTRNKNMKALSKPMKAAADKAGKAGEKERRLPDPHFYGLSRRKKTRPANQRHRAATEPVSSRRDNTRQITR